MAMVTDPVCGMRIDDDDAAATAEHDGATYYFCSQACHDAFVATSLVRRLTADGDRLRRRSSSPSGRHDGRRIRELVDLGILGPRRQFRRRDVMVVRVVVTLEAKGIDREDRRRGVRSGHLTLGYLESAGRRHPRSDTTFAGSPRTSASTSRRSNASTSRSGFRRSGTRRARQPEDLEVLRMLPVLISGGVAEARCCAWPGSGARRARKVAQYLTTTCTTRSRSSSAVAASGTTRRSRRPPPRSGTGRTLGRGHARLAVPTALRDVHHRASVRARRDGARAGRRGCDPRRPSARSSSPT